MSVARDTPRLRRVRRSGTIAGPLLAAGALLVAGLLLRLPVFLYGGPRSQLAFNNYIFGYPGSYSDIASLYFRDHLWLHPAPYFDYRLEYPVLTGAFVWLAGLAAWSVKSYLLVSALGLGLCALGAVWLLRRFPGSNAWILALAPGLAFDAVLNWDLLAIALLLASLLLYERARDGWAGAALALAVSAKLFPLLALPLVCVVRARERSWRALARGLGAFAAVSALVNLPVALQLGSGSRGFVLRHSWAYFFRFNEERHSAEGLWWLLRPLHPTAHQINSASAWLLVAATAVVMAAMVWGSRRAPAISLLRAALLALMAWLLFINKVYSPQYGLWVVALLALAGAPLWLAVPFVAVDGVFYAVSFLSFNVNHQWYFSDVMRPAVAVRELALLAVLAWSIDRVAAPAPPPAPSAERGWPALEPPLLAAPGSR